MELRALDGFGSFEEVADGEELDAGELAALGAGGAGRGVEAGFGGLAEHGFGWFLEGDVDADLGLLALQDADEVADLGDADVVSSLYGEDDLAGGAGVVVVEVEAAVDAAVGPLLDALGGTRSAESERPVLELVLVLFGELGGPGHVDPSLIERRHLLRLPTRHGWIEIQLEKILKRNNVEGRSIGLVALLQSFGDDKVDSRLSHRIEVILSDCLVDGCKKEAKSASPFCYDLTPTLSKGSFDCEDDAVHRVARVLRYAQLGKAKCDVKTGTVLN